MFTCAVQNRAPVFVLDSATYLLSADALKRSLWYIVNKKMVNSIVPQRVDDQDMYQLLRFDGNLHHNKLVRAGFPAVRLALSWLACCPLAVVSVHTPVC